MGRGIGGGRGASVGVRGVWRRGEVGSGRLGGRGREGAGVGSCTQPLRNRWIDCDVVWLFTAADGRELVDVLLKAL